MILQTISAEIELKQLTGFRALRSFENVKLPTLTTLKLRKFAATKNFIRNVLSACPLLCYIEIGIRERNGEAINDILKEFPAGIIYRTFFVG
jgi:hypothetical protein